MHVLLVEPFGMPTSHPHQARHGLFGHMDEPGCRPDATAFAEMVDPLLGLGLWKLCVEQGGAAPFRELFPAAPTTQQADTVVPIHLADDKVASSCPAKQLAFSIDTR
jgi:hypothetical protein